MAVVDNSTALDFDDVATRLYSAVLSDILDHVGLRHQVLPPDIRPLDPTRPLVGRAATILAAAEYTLPERPYVGMMDAMDRLQPDTIVVIDTARATQCAFWGELFSTAALARRARGTLVDGYIRDTQRILDMRYPVFARGALPVDINGRSRAIDTQCVVEIGGVAIAPGDLIFGDRDGAVVIPRAVEREVLGRAYEKVSKENVAREALQRGAFLHDVWDQHGVL